MHGETTFSQKWPSFLTGVPWTFIYIFTLENIPTQKHEGED